MLQQSSLTIALLFCWLLPIEHASAVEQEPHTLAVQVDQIVQQLIDEHHVPGLSIAVAVDHQLRFAKGYGLADVESEVPVTDATKFRTASIAKSLTAATILSLSEQGSIDLDAEIQKYCPDFPQKQSPVTVRQLLGHLGGIRHYARSGESTSTKHFYSLQSALATFRNDPLVHDPGSKYLYSSFGYNLLGSIVEGACDAEFVDVLKENVLDPCGMKETCADDHFQIIAGRSRGYFRPNSKRLESFPTDHRLIADNLYNAPLHDTSMKIPGGGLLSTPSDLVRFAVALSAGKLLTSETCQQMWTAQTTTTGESTGYGLGWKINRSSDPQIVSHTGGQSGTSTVLALAPQTGTAVAIMCNLQDTQLLATAIQIISLVVPDTNRNPGTRTADYTDAMKKLDDAVRMEVQQKQLPAFSISAVDGDQVVWSSGYGFQDPERKIQATGQTIYRVGSVSKLFTDIAVMQQVETGQLDLDAPIQQYVPDFTPQNDSGIPITLRQLMSHRSGLVRESPVGNYFDPTEPSLAATIASLNQTALVYQPETKTKYSNAAIAVVGAALQHAMGTSHAAGVQASIMQPLEMHDTNFELTDQVRSKLATGWMRTIHGPRFAAPEFLLGTGPAGNLYSSTEDLAKLMVCLFRGGKTPTGQICREETLRQMTTPIKNNRGESEGFGIGFQIQSFDGETKIGHGGAVYGFSTQLEALPERRIGIAAVAALDGSNGVVKRLSEYALRLMISVQEGNPLPEYEFTIPIVPERINEIVGDYRTADESQFVRIDNCDGRAMLRRASVHHVLRAKQDGASFVTDDPAGYGVAVERLSANQIKVGDVTYDRADDRPPPPCPDRWNGLIGEYGWDHNTLYLLEEQGVLYALIEWFYYYPLTEIDENTYQFPDYGLYHGEGLKFQRGADGNATEVIAAEVRFQRREVGTKDGETFKIIPAKPIEELRTSALQASPPPEYGDFRDADLIELISVDPTFALNIRYATTNNFTGAVFYNQPRAFMQRDAAQAVAAANQQLKSRGLGLLIHDAYRPWYVTKMFWDATPGEFKDFVANPANGSRHNRGCAVDLTLYDLESGEPIQMVAGYDEFSPRSFPDYPGGTSQQRWYRNLLRRTMESNGFSVYQFEWWHFDFKDWQKYRIGNDTFENLNPISSQQQR